jgi:hypothetical protein
MNQDLNKKEVFVEDLENEIIGKNSNSKIKFVSS